MSFVRIEETEDELALPEPHLLREHFLALIDHSHVDHLQRLILHHLAVCPGCYESAGYILDRWRSGALAPELDTVDIELAQSRFEAPALFNRLWKLPPGDRRVAAEADITFHRWGLVELLCEKSRAATTHQRKRAVELAELAVTIASAIPEGEPIDALWLSNIRALAWAHLGSACRAAGDCETAVQAFLETHNWVKAGKELGDPFEYEMLIQRLIRPRKKRDRPAARVG
jgi:hypothetical protein